MRRSDSERTGATDALLARQGVVIPRRKTREKSLQGRCTSHKLAERFGDEDDE
jgi:hypothetical protein